MKKFNLDEMLKNNGFEYDDFDNSYTLYLKLKNECWNKDSKTNYALVLEAKVSVYRNGGCSLKCYDCHSGDLLLIKRYETISKRAWDSISTTIKRQGFEMPEAV